MTKQLYFNLGQVCVIFALMTTGWFTAGLFGIGMILFIIGYLKGPYRSTRMDRWLSILAALALVFRGVTTQQIDLIFLGIGLTIFLIARELLRVK